MSRFVYQAEHLDFLRENFPKLGIPELRNEFNKQFGLDKSEAQIRAACKNHRIRCGRKMGELRKGKSDLFTEEQVSFLKVNYPVMSRKELTRALNESFKSDFKLSQVVAFLKNKKIKSTRDGRFQIGSTPWNTGTKGVCKKNSGSFLPGREPSNLKKYGDERVDSDGYRLIKCQERNPYTNAIGFYRHLQVVVWEEAYGPVPEGKIVCFKNGDRRNCEIDNLELRSRAEQLALNQHGYREAPKELKPTVRMLAEMSMKRGELRRIQAKRRKNNS